METLPVLFPDERGLVLLLGVGYFPSVRMRLPVIAGRLGQNLSHRKSVTIDGTDLVIPAAIRGKFLQCVLQPGDVFFLPWDVRQACIEIEIQTAVPVLDGCQFEAVLHGGALLHKSAQRVAKASV